MPTTRKRRTRGRVSDPPLVALLRRVGPHVTFADVAEAVGTEDVGCETWLACCALEGVAFADGRGTYDELAAIVTRAGWRVSAVVAALDRIGQESVALATRRPVSLPEVEGPS